MAAAGKTKSAPPASPTKALRKLLVMPVMARHGASQGTGTAISQLLAASMSEMHEYDVSSYDGVAFGMKDPLIAPLARCPDLGCATELGRTLGFDEVIVGTMDAIDGTPLLVMWRVDVVHGSVAGIYEVPLTDDALDALSRKPEMMVEALMHPAKKAPSPPSIGGSSFSESLAAINE